MPESSRPIYLDNAATTPIDPRVRDVVLHYMEMEFGNAGSRTHIYGQEAARAVKRAREQIAAVVNARPEEVIFTSGATEANNLAILGLAEYGARMGKRHIISTQIEHKAVLEPLRHLSEQGFEIELVPTCEGGYIDADDLANRLRDDTFLVSVMHVNNETGVIQPINAVADAIRGHEAYFHVDAAQGYGKELPSLRDSRIDLISCSAHKLYSPKGIGCLIVRRERKASRCLTPLTYGGGQEKGLRPGTLPVSLIAGFGKAASLSSEYQSSWRMHWNDTLAPFIELLSKFNATIHGNTDNRLENIISFSIPSLDSEALMINLKDIISISNGSACTSSKIEHSHVISAMYGEDSPHIATTCRISVSHLTPKLPCETISIAMERLL